MSRKVEEEHTVVIALQKTWTCSDHTLVETEIPRYKEVRAVRSNSRGGGVSLYLMDRMTVTKTG